MSWAQLAGVVALGVCAGLIAAAIAFVIVTWRR